MKKLYSIKTKAFAIVGFVMLLILVAFISMFSKNMFKLLVQNEFDTSEQDGRIAKGILNASVENASAITRDWSSWDETYQYVLGENPNYPNDILTNYPFLLHKFNFIIISDTQNNIVFNKFFDFVEEEEMQEPEGLLNFLTPILADVLPEFQAHHDYSFQKKVGKEGFFFANGVCYYIAVLPVLTSDETSDVVGTYTFGRIYDEEQINRITSNENMRFTLSDINSPEIKGLNLEFKDETAFVTSRNTIYAYAKTADFFGDESIVIGVKKSRALYNDGVRYALITSTMIVFGIFMLVFVLYFLLDLFVLKPIRKISGDLEAINDDTLTVTGKHYNSSKEFAALQGVINRMLSRQEQSKLALKIANDMLTDMAYYDSLTGLYNINKFKIAGEETLKLYPDLSFVVIKIDILNFKIVNEMFGFEIGDVVVQAVGNYIQKIRVENGLAIGAVARINADEFIMLDLAAEEEGDKRAEMLEKGFNEQIGGILGNHHIEFRFGRYYLDKGETDINSAIEKANIAHRIAKTQKNRKTCNYDDAFKQRVLRETEIQNKMEAALINEEFKVYLQPKYSLGTEKIVGAEALVRWQESGGRLIPPGEFIPLFERNGFVTKLDMYMFEHVCAMIKRRISAGQRVATVSVNFSRLHLLNDKFAETLLEITSRYGIPRKHIEIELTESVIFDNEELLKKLLNDLHDVGFTLSMDDFGSGYSSLGLLKNLPVDVVKIDRSFFTDDMNNKRATAVIESVMLMTKKLGIQTVAEGVETKEHVNFLKEVGCDIVQGYYYAKPMPMDEFEKELQ